MSGVVSQPGTDETAAKPNCALTNSGSLTGCTLRFSPRLGAGRYACQCLIHLLAQALQRGLRLVELVLDAQHPPIPLYGSSCSEPRFIFLHFRDVPFSRRCPVALGGGTAMPDARSVVGVKRSDIALRREPRFGLQRFIGCHGVRSLWGRRGRLAGSGRPSVNKPKPARPGSARGGRLRRELYPGDSSKERQRTLHVRIRTDNADAAADVRGEAGHCTASAPTVELSPGIALLASMGVHFTALRSACIACWRADLRSRSMCCLATSGWHRLTLRLGSAVRVVAFRLVSGCRWRVLLCPGIELTVDGPLDDAERYTPAGLRMPRVATTRGPFVQHVLPQRGINLLQCHLGTRLLLRLQLCKALGPLQIAAARAPAQ